MPRYVGLVINVGRRGDFAFISRGSVTKPNGKKDSRLNGVNNDLYLRTDQNPDLPASQHLLENRSITFMLDFDNRDHTGQPIVYKARLV